MPTVARPQPPSRGFGARSLALCTAITLASLSAGCSGGSTDGAAGSRTSASDPTSAASGPTTKATSGGPASPSSTPNQSEPPSDPPASPGTEMHPDVPGAQALQAGESHPVEDPYYPETSNPEVDVLHYFLDLAYQGDTLSGTATVTFRATEPTSKIRLDLSDTLEVEGVTLDDARISFGHEDNGLTMTTPKMKPGPAHTFVIRYSGRPAPVPAPSKREDMTAGLGWQTESDGTVYTIQEPYGAFTWYPVNDHPSDEALYDARITTSSPDVGVFNGVLEDNQVHGGLTTTRWHVDEPMAAYVTTLEIGPYEQYSGRTKSGLTITYWLMERDKRLFPHLSSAGAAAFDWLVEHAGPYPFSSMGVVVVGGQGTMETQTMITLDRGAAALQAFGDNTLQHEMAHQWYGDSVTPTNWQGMWLNEGWATYLQQRYSAETQPKAPSGAGPKVPGGQLTFRQLDNRARRQSGPPGDYKPGHFADVNVYIGPALMLGEIRKQVGDQKFDQLVKAWPAQHENENVGRAEFTRWVNKFTGNNLTPLIDRWLDSPHTPPLS